MSTYIYDIGPNGEKIYYGTQYNANGERVTDRAVLEELQAGKIEAVPRAASTRTQADVDAYQASLSAQATATGGAVQAPTGTTFVNGAPYAAGQTAGAQPTASIQPVANNTTLPTQVGATTSTQTTAPNTTTPQPTPATPTTPTQPQLTPEQMQQAYEQSGLTDLMQTAGLTPDQQRAIEAVYQATLTNDQAYADRIAAALQASSEFNEPYFKAQIDLVSDSLSRALTAQEGDLAFREQQLQKTLQKLQQDTAASKDYLSFQHEQELNDLARKYEINLEDTRQSMAATGFTQSSRRSKAEQYLNDVNEGAVESSNRSLAYQTGGLDRQVQFQQQDAAAQAANLQRLAQEGKLNLLRQTETQLGSAGLQGLGYSGTDVLGGIGGQIPREKALADLSFASNSSYVF